MITGPPPGITTFAPAAQSTANKAGDVYCVSALDPIVPPYKKGSLPGGGCLPGYHESNIPAGGLIVPPYQAVNSAQGAGESGVKAVQGAASAVGEWGKVTSWLDSKEHWKGIGLIALASVLGLGGVALFVSSTKSGQTIIKAAAA